MATLLTISYPDPFLGPQVVPPLIEFPLSGSSSRDEEISELINEILEGQGPLRLDPTDRHFEELKGFLYLLLRTENGWSLIQEIKAHEGVIDIASEDSDKKDSRSHYQFKERKVYLKITSSFYQLVKMADDTFSVESLGSTLVRVAILGHELFHGLIDMQGQSACSEPPVGDADFDSLEEEVVIETGEFAENKTREELGLGARIDHRIYPDALKAIVYGIEKGIPLSQFLHDSGGVWGKEDLKKALIKAAFCDLHEAVSQLLEAAITPWTAEDLKDVLLEFPLMGDGGIIEQLLEAATTPWRVEDLKEILGHAVFCGSESCVVQILACASDAWTPEDLKESLNFAAIEGNTANVRHFLAAAAGQWTAQDLKEALNAAVWRGHVEIVEQLLAFAADTWTAQDLKEALNCAARDGSEAIVEQLLAVAEGSWTLEILRHALVYAMIKGREVAVGQLLDAAQGQWTPADLQEVLTAAALRGQDAIVAKLRAAVGDGEGAL